MLMYKQLFKMKNRLSLWKMSSSLEYGLGGLVKMFNDGPFLNC